ncbi:MAG: carboxypeptidase-like regulatory domain-containing protein [bacterium]|nr:carboxypeptidase-like regulatory domain-containing protein [bacterium]
MPAENLKISDEMDPLTELQGKIQVGGGSLTQNDNKFETAVPYKVYPGNMEPVMYRIKISSQAQPDAILKNTATAVADNASSVSAVFSMLVVNPTKTPEVKKQKEIKKIEETKKSEETKETQEVKPAEETAPQQKIEAAKITTVNQAKPLYIAPMALETSPAAVSTQTPAAKKTAITQSQKKLSLQISGAATSLPSGEIYTNNVSPTISGQIVDTSISAGSVIKIEINGQEVCQVVLQDAPNRIFTCVPQIKFSDGAYQVVITAGDYSQTQTLVIDTQAPAPPPPPILQNQTVNPVQMAGLMGVEQNEIADIGALTVDQGKVVASLTFSGRVNDADWRTGIKQARLTINSSPIIKTINLISQDWNYNVNVVLEPGDHQATLVLIDLADNVSAPSEPMKFIVGEPSVFAKTVVAPVAQTIDKTIKTVTAGTDAILNQPTVKAVTRNVEKVIDNPRVEKVNETYAAPAVAVATAATTAGAINFVSLLNFLQALITQPILLLERRRRKGWGVVYNSLTKLPVDLALVRLFSAPTGKLLQTRVTDKSGRYAFIVEKGLYRLEVSASNYQYPTEYIKDKKQDLDYLDIYHGEPFNMAQDGETVALNIPIDRVEQAKASKEVIRKLRFRTLQSVVAFIGPLCAFISFTISQTALIFAFVVLQVVLYLLFKRLSFVHRPKSWGVVYDKQTKKPIKYVLVRIFEQNYNKLLDTQVTDSKGHYSFLVGRNVYYLTFDKQGYISQKTGNLDTASQQKEASLGVDVGLERLPK